MSNTFQPPAIKETGLMRVLSDIERELVAGGGGSGTIVVTGSPPTFPGAYPGPPVTWGGHGDAGGGGGDGGGYGEPVDPNSPFMCEDIRNELAQIDEIMIALLRELNEAKIVEGVALGFTALPGFVRELYVGLSLMRDGFAEGDTAKVLQGIIKFAENGKMIGAGIGAGLYAAFMGQFKNELQAAVDNLEAREAYLRGAFDAGGCGDDD